MKFSTRFDSPACLDLFDKEYQIGQDGKSVSVKAMCRNDKKLLQYSLELLLNGEISQDTSLSYFEESSVGRLYIVLAKKESPSKWKRLVAPGASVPSKMRTWWEVYEKHEKDLQNFKNKPSSDEVNEADESEQNK